MRKGDAIKKRCVCVNRGIYEFGALSAGRSKFDSKRIHRRLYSRARISLERRLSTAAAFCSGRDSVRLGEQRLSTSIATSTVLPVSSSFASTVYTRCVYYRLHRLHRLQTDVCVCTLYGVHHRVHHNSIETTAITQIVNNTILAGCRWSNAVGLMPLVECRWSNAIEAIARMLSNTVGRKRRPMPLVECD